MTDSSPTKTESPLEEQVLSETEAKEKFGDSLTEEAQAEFQEDAVEAFSAPEEKKRELSEEEAAEIFGDGLVQEAQTEFREDAVEAFTQETHSEEEVLSEKEAEEKFGEGLVAEAQSEFQEDAVEAFSPLEEEKQELSEEEAAQPTVAPDYLLTDQGIQALLSIFWDGFQRDEDERKAFFQEALSKDEFQFFHLLSERKATSDLEFIEGKIKGIETPLTQTKEEKAFEYSQGLAQIAIQMRELREVRRNAITLLSWCIGLFSILALVSVILFSTPHLSQGKATLLAFLLVVPGGVIGLAVITLGRVWEYFTFIHGSGEPIKELSDPSLVEAGDFLTKGLEGIAEKHLQNKNALHSVSKSIEQSIQRLILAGGLLCFSVTVWISLGIASTFQKFISWEHVGFFVFTSFFFFVVTFFLRIGYWKNPKSAKTWGWCFALAVFIFTLFGAGAVARGPIRIDPGAMPEISSSWMHNLSPNGFFEGLRGWFYPGIALERVSPKS
ncbi:hypothetical protein FAI40_07910 [Acetobacteraceae bacterium]|nr:hypothetical protein FAI40_07910 [Acetobacteraceae bacterium]